MASKRQRPRPRDRIGLLLMTAFAGALLVIWIILVFSLWSMKWP